MRVRFVRPLAVPPLTPVATVDATAEGGDFEPRRAWALLRAQYDLGPRYPGAPGHRATRELLLDRLSRCADEVMVQDWVQRVATGAGAGRRFPMTNVLALIHGTHRRGRPALLVGTHWDTRPVADADPDPRRRAEPAPGASDGASGVAVLLELARALRAVRPAQSVAFAFFDGEDLGEYCYGSRLFARTLRRRQEWRPDAAVVIDMIGGRGMRCATETRSVAQAPALWNAVHASAAALGLERRFHGPAARVGDDHVPLQRAGVPAVLLIDRSYPQWHTVADTPDACEPASLDAIGRVLLHLVRQK
ncbi:glutamine cyclotransferase [Virgisporangium aliadipatigenens]|uniref:Glutamine cyclotransferase n=1 Tax=Virgisporangium aliadipatigenens TaxID=741659 RepID=A0A8J4DWI4_9ACTN|nr:M28 family peptidase [Virgisporangium aliadipatigenens]GIJ52288.1 glutamine cyclotransferase [Virgisporangium aliadipatigenens]